MAKLPRLSGKEVIKALSKVGFVSVRQKGSHVIMLKETPQGKIGLASMTSMYGCSCETKNEKYTEQKTQTESIPINFEYKGNIGNILTYNNGCGVALGDMDGDGDLDIMVVGNGRLEYFENNMPQKNK